MCYSFSISFIPSAIIPPVQPVAISAISCQTPRPDKIPSTIMAKNICGRSFPIILLSFISSNYGSLMNNDIQLNHCIEYGNNFLLVLIFLFVSLLIIFSHINTRLGSSSGSTTPKFRLIFLSTKQNNYLLLFLLYL